MTEYVMISFEAAVMLPLDDVDACLGDAAAAVQDHLGSRAHVVSAAIDHIDEDDGGDLSLDALAEREAAAADRRWPEEEDDD